MVAVLRPMSDASSSNGGPMRQLRVQHGQQCSSNTARAAVQHGQQCSSNKARAAVAAVNYIGEELGSHPERCRYITHICHPCARHILQAAPSTHFKQQHTTICQPLVHLLCSLCISLIMFVPFHFHSIFSSHYVPDVSISLNFQVQESRQGAQTHQLHM